MVGNPSQGNDVRTGAGKKNEINSEMAFWFLIHEDRGFLVSELRARTETRAAEYRAKLVAAWRRNRTLGTPRGSSSSEGSEEMPPPKGPIFSDQELAENNLLDQILEENSGEVSSGKHLGPNKPEIAPTFDREHDLYLAELAWEDHAHNHAINVDYSTPWRKWFQKACQTVG